MTQIDRLQQALARAKNSTRAQRQLLVCIDQIDRENQIEVMEQHIIKVIARLDGRDVRSSIPERRGGRLLTSRDACKFLDIGRSSLVALVQGGHITPVDRDVSNGAPHRYDRAHLQNFLTLHSSGEIRRMLADYRGRKKEVPRRTT